MQIVRLLGDLCDRLRLSYIFHHPRPPIVRNLADRIPVMKSGRVVEEAPTETLFRNPRDAYTKPEAVPNPSGRIAAA